MAPIPRSKIATGAATALLSETTMSNPRRVQVADADADMSMIDAPKADVQDPLASTKDVKKRKRKEKETHILHQTTCRKPTWAYFHLTLIAPGTAALPSPSFTTSSNTRDLDALTVSALLLQPLTAYLGTTGSAIPIDILHTQGRSAYVRIPSQDARVFQAGLSGWIGNCDAGSVSGVEEGGRVRVAWRVVAEGGSLGLFRGSGEEIFGENGVAY